MALRPGRPEHLGKDLQRLAPLDLQGLAEHGLGLSVRIHVGGVERRDAGIQGSAYASLGLIVFQLRAVRQPVAVSDL
jgi:hypothetical protein